MLKGNVYSVERYVTQSLFTDSEGFSSAEPTVFWVCNYQSQGNVLGMPVYRAGTSCSACPSTHPVCIQGLCSPGEADSGDENFGAMVFPEGDDVKENTTEPAAPEEFPPEEQLKRLDKADLDEDINATALKHQRKQHQKLKPQHKPHQKYRVTKRGVPDGGVLVPGDCQDGRFHTWVEVDRGSFSDNGMHSFGFRTLT